MNTEKIKKVTERIEKDEGRMNLSLYMAEVIEELKDGRKHPAVHTYTSTLHSFAAFSGDAMPMNEVFTPGRLKEYEDWLLQRRLSWNTISTYMRTLQAVYNRLSPPGTPEHNPRLFDDVYTKVKSQIKRALTEEQMGRLMHADLDVLSEELQRVHAVHRPCTFAQAGRERWQNSVSSPQDGQTDHIAYPPGSTALAERV